MRENTCSELDNLMLTAAIECLANIRKCGPLSLGQNTRLGEALTELLNIRSEQMGIKEEPK